MNPSNWGESAASVQIIQFFCQQHEYGSKGGANPSCHKFYCLSCREFSRLLWQKPMIRNKEKVK